MTDFTPGHSSNRDAESKVDGPSLVAILGAEIACIALTFAALYAFPPANDPNACRNPAMVLNPCRDVLPDGFFPPDYTGPRLREK